MKGKIGRFIRYGVATGLLACALFCTTKIVTTLNDLHSQSDDDDTLKQIISEETAADDNTNTDDGTLAIPDELKRAMHLQTMSKSSYEKLYNINSDLVGYITLDNSDSLQKPLVQTTNNTYYMSHTFYKQYASGGAVFLNSDCNMDSQNLVIYGHNSSYDIGIGLSTFNSIYLNEYPQNENRYLTIYNENEVRRYKIVYMFDYGDFTKFDHQQWNFTEDEFNKWIAQVESRNNYDNDGDHITYEDKFITLQTCQRFNSSHRVITIAKEIGRYEYVK